MIVKLMSLLPSRTDNKSRAIVLMVLGVGCLSINDALIKWLSSGLGVGQILGMRGVLVILLYGAFISYFKGPGVFRMVNPKAHALRGGFLVISAYTFVSGLSLLPLADAFALSFAGPLFMVVIAIFFLGEKVGWRRWVAVTIGFLAVLIMLQPGSDAFQLAALFPLIAALSGAIRDAFTRRMAAAETTHSILLSGTAAVTLGGFASVPFGWLMPSLIDGGILLATAVMQCLAHYLMIEAFRFGETSLLAPFKYSSLVWGLLLGLLVWGEFPATYILIGAAIITASGIYIAHREAQSH